MPAARYWRVIDLETHGGGELELSALHLYTGSAADEHYNSVSLLLNANGADNSTVFTDTSPTPKTVTAVGNAKISTSQSKFGGSSMYFDGTGDYLTSPSSTDFDLGGTYTVEFWVLNLKAYEGGGIIHRGFYSTGSNTWAGVSLSIRGLGSTYTRVYFYATTPADEQYLDITGLMPTNTWRHVAVVREATVGKVYLDGVLAGTKTGLSTNAVSTQSLRAGVWDYNAGSEYFNGYLDDIRITKGIARYTANFTPPIAEFPSSAMGTTLTRSADATATLTSTFAPISGTLAGLQDTDLNTVTRFDTNVPRFALQWDFGAGNTADISAVAPGSSDLEAEFIARLILQYSTDTYLWTTLNAFGQYVWPGANAMVDVTTGAVPSEDYYNSVSLLLNGNGADNSVVFTDTSPAPKVITAFGNAKISTAQSKFGGSSMYFDGAGDYLTVPSTTALEPGDMNLTVECWVRCNATPAEAGGLFLKPNLSGYANFSISWRSTNKIEAYCSLATVTDAPVLLYSSSTQVINTWYHLAFVKAGLNYKLFINGNIVAEGNAASHPPTGIPTTSYIGSYSASSYFFNGYIDDLRITKGVARYTAAFTPPAAEFPAAAAVSVGDAYYENTVLSLHGNGANNSTVFTDTSVSPKTVTAVGDAKISTVQSKFGGSSMYFDGAGDYLTTVSSDGYAFGVGDFTIEAWFRPTGNTGGMVLQPITNGWALMLYNGGLYFQNSFNVSSIISVASPAIFDSLWHHIAVSRADGNNRIFIDGVQIGNTVISNANYALTTGLEIGRNSGASHFYNGYIDDLRITKVARYTANFTPPAVQFDDYQLAGGIYGPRPVPVLNEQQFLSWPGSFPVPNGVGDAPNNWATAYDPYHGGVGRIVGTVKEKSLPDNVPLGRKVWLMDEASKMVIRETWSDPTTGDYEFTGIRMGTKYAVFAYDYTGAYRAVIADNQEATL